MRPPLFCQAVLVLPQLPARRSDAGEDSGETDSNRRKKNYEVGGDVSEELSVVPPWHRVPYIDQFAVVGLP